MYRGYTRKNSLESLGERRSFGIITRRRTVQTIRAFRFIELDRTYSRETSLLGGRIVDNEFKEGTSGTGTKYKVNSFA